MKKQGDPDLSVTSPLIFDVLPFKKKTSQLCDILENWASRNLSDKNQNIRFLNAKYILCL